MEQLQTDIAGFDAAWDEELEQAVTDLHHRQPNPCP